MLIEGKSAENSRGDCGAKVGVVVCCVGGQSPGSNEIRVAHDTAALALGKMSLLAPHLKEEETSFKGGGERGRWNEWNFLLPPSFEYGKIPGEERDVFVPPPSQPLDKEEEGDSWAIAPHT